MRYDQSHNTPYDRGWTDAFRARPMRPHYKGKNITDPEVTEKDMTAVEILAYQAGYHECEEEGMYGAKW